MASSTFGGRMVPASLTKTNSARAEPRAAAMLATLGLPSPSRLIATRQGTRQAPRALRATASAGDAASAAHSVMSQAG